MDTTELKRVFIHNNSRFNDPDPGMTADEVRAHLAAMHPELASASIDGPVIADGLMEFTFRTTVGTKG